jgi:predicted nucleotidyltransferase
MDMLRILRDKRDEIVRIARRYGASNVRVFGSVARGDATDESDLDLLIRLERGRTLLDLAGLGDDLEALLGRRVQIVTEGGVHPLLQDRIYAEAAPL